jgi:hypothetical protein
MNQSDLNREVAKATGEPVGTIAQRGFVPLTSVPFEQEPSTVDWDQVEADRRTTFSRPSIREPAAC